MLPINTPSYSLQAAFVFTFLISLLKTNAQKDPIKDFCRRFDHQTAVIGNRLYIDGGLLNWNPISQNPENVTSKKSLNKKVGSVLMCSIDTYLMYSDLSELENGMPKVFANSTKNSSVPSVAGGILWPDTVNKVFYSFGGYFPQTTPQLFSPWLYNTQLDRWEVVETKGDKPSYVAHGMGTVATDKGIAYYLGGYHSNKTEAGWGSDLLYTSNLMKFDMISRQYTNDTGPDDRGKGEGVMLFIPVSHSGILIYFGGVVQDPKNRNISGVCQLPIHSII
jgi:hypothetical protein